MKSAFVKFFAAVCFVILIPYKSISQKVVTDLNAYMRKVRMSKYEPIPKYLLGAEKKEKEFINALVPYLRDTAESVKERAYYILKQLGLESKDQKVRQEAVRLLCNGIRDKSTAISGNITSSLCLFNRGDFTDVAKDSIVSAIVVTTPHLEQVIKLAGYLGIRESLQKLTEFSNSTKVTWRWASILARARMNDNEATSYILNKLNTATISDDFVYDVVPDLIYIRQKKIFSFLDQIIKSDKPSCSSANPDSNEKILCGYHVMELMAPVIIGFPLKLDESGNLLETDYQKSLERLRNWINQNSRYQIQDNSF